MEEKTHVIISIYEFIGDMEFSKDNKNEMIELLTNHNQLRSQNELKEIKDFLHEACQKGDLELIEIYLNENIKDETNGLTFKINKTNKTASLSEIDDKQIEHLIVPRTVQHESDEYLITSICWIGDSYTSNLNIKTIKFAEDSSVSKFYSNSFSFSKIEEIYFPKSLKELKEGWCFNTRNLKKIIISPSNDQFIFKEDKYLLGKSDKNSDEFDILLFVNRDLKKFSIPTNIKIISSSVFSYSKIEEIFIPPNVLKIGEYAFSGCSNLKKVEIPTNSNLQIIERDAFSDSKIEEIFIPQNVSKICERAFCFCSNLKKVEIPTNSNLQTIEREAFLSANIEEIFIPPNVSKICERAFCFCSNLKKVEIPTNSNLQQIEREAFSITNIEEIFIPPNVSIICEGAFSYCQNLQIAEISEESKLQSFSSSAFLQCPKVMIMIPPSLKTNFK